jgi:hypothetical protein
MPKVPIRRSLRLSKNNVNQEYFSHSHNWKTTTSSREHTKYDFCESKQETDASSNNDIPSTISDRNCRSVAYYRPIPGASAQLNDCGILPSE